MGRGFINSLKVAGIWLSSAIFVPSTYITVWLDRLLKFPLPFPRNVDELVKKQDWCVDVLKKNGILPKEADVLHYKVIPLQQELIFRSNAGIIEIEYEEAGTLKTLKCFAKFAPVSGSVWNRTVFNLQLNHIKETHFNRYVLPNHPAIAAPAVYYSEVSSLTGNLCLITEYMDNCELHLDGLTGDISSKNLNLALENLASLHAEFWKDNGSQTAHVFPITEATVYFFESLVKTSWSAPARKILVKSWNLLNEPQTYLHGDARIGNMLFPGTNTSGRFALIDWQAVRKGKAVYDLAYFLILSLSAETRNHLEQQAMETYYLYLVAKGVTGYSKEEMEEDYRHACLCLLVLLSLPMLSGEASAEGEGAKIFSWGMGIWRQRMQQKFETFDYAWLARKYQITEQQGRSAVAEMLGVIEERLRLIAG